MNKLRQLIFSYPYENFALIHLFQRVKRTGIETMGADL